MSYATNPIASENVTIARRGSSSYTVTITTDTGNVISVITKEVTIDNAPPDEEFNPWGDPQQAAGYRYQQGIDTHPAVGKAWPQSTSAPITGSGLVTRSAIHEQPSLTTELLKSYADRIHGNAGLTRALTPILHPRTAETLSALGGGGQTADLKTWTGAADTWEEGAVRAPSADGVVSGIVGPTETETQ